MQHIFTLNSPLIFFPCDSCVIFSIETVFTPVYLLILNTVYYFSTAFEIGLFLFIYCHAISPTGINNVCLILIIGCVWYICCENPTEL